MGDAKIDEMAGTGPLPQGPSSPVQEASSGHLGKAPQHSCERSGRGHCPLGGWSRFYRGGDSGIRSTRMIRISTGREVGARLFRPREEH